MIGSLDYTSQQSPFHLKNVLTTERACRHMREAGVDPALCSNPLLWYDSLAKKCMFPQDRAVTTFKYIAEQVFWYHSEYIGLSEHLFPHVDLQADLLSSIMSGGSVEYFLSPHLRNPGQLDERRFATTYERVRLLLENNWLISREELMLNNLVTYETNNEFIHKAAEAKLIYSRLEKECPVHFPETLMMAQEGCQMARVIGRSRFD
jgi:hypothetical protein